MHVRIRSFGLPDRIVVVQSKLMKIEQLKQTIDEKFKITPQSQRLFYGGKLLENNCTLYDYNIKLNDVIQVIVNSEAAPSTSKANIMSKEQNTEENLKSYLDAESILYELEDLVDVKHKIQGKWQEGKIIRIVHDPERLEDDNNELSYGEHDVENHQPNVQVGESSTKVMNKVLTNRHTLKAPTPLLYKVQLDNEEEEEYYTESHIRPRARTVLNVKDIKVGQRVMVNYSIELPNEKGDWYDFKVEEVRKLRKNYELLGTLYFGEDLVPQYDTKVKVHDKIFAIEEAVCIAQRTEEYNTMMKTQPEIRSKPIICLLCRDKDGVPCRECGCSVCSDKQEPEKIMLCDECNAGYHMGCLEPALNQLPEGDWYCPKCARDTTAVVAPGASSQPRKKLRTSRDWGRGMACVGKTKTCAMPANHFGPIPGIEVGMCWRFRIQLSESGVHRPPVSGIHGRDVEGAYSIVLSGGYEDDVDNGNEFTYTGSGGRDLSGNKRTAEQSCDQRLIRENRALARNCAAGEVSESGGDAGEQWRDGKAVRVVRSYKMLRHFPKYAPPEGIRYDGIYKVVKYYQEKGLSGFKVWKYLLRRDDPSPAPWERGATKYPVIYPDGYLEAEAEKKALKEKNAKTTKSSKRKDLHNNNPSNYVCSELSPEEKVTNDFEQPSTSKNSVREVKKRKLRNNNVSSESASEELCLDENVTSDFEQPTTSKKPKISYKKRAMRNKNMSPDSKSQEVCLGENVTDDLKQPLSPKKSEGKTQKRALRDINLSSDSASEELPSRKKRKVTPVQSTTSKQGTEHNFNDTMKNKVPSMFSSKIQNYGVGENVNSFLSKEEMEAINADTLNTKLWTECLGAQLNGKKEFVEFVTQTFICIICRDTVVNPVTTECLHNYCLTCLRMAFRANADDGKKPSCSYCRHEFTTTPSVADINVPLRVALRAIMPGYDGCIK